jgi:hypothetical protein
MYAGGLEGSRIRASVAASCMLVVGVAFRGTLPPELVHAVVADVMRSVLLGSISVTE